MLTNQYTRKLLTIPDPHSQPGVDGARFDWLGNAILAERPDVVVHLGDHWDFASLGGYDDGTLHGEGQRYAEELEKGWEDLKRITDPIRNAKKRLPQMVLLTGNHEARPDKYVTKNPKLEGTMGNRDWIKLAEDLGWTVLPFLEIVRFGGVAFSHYFTSGKMGRASSSPNVALNGKSGFGDACVYGHGHVLDAGFKHTNDGTKTALEAGCYFEQHMGYASTQDQARWWRGLHLLHNVKGGCYDHEAIRMERVKERWA